MLGIFIKKAKKANLIAGFNPNDDTVDEEKLTWIAGNTLIYIGVMNTLIVIMSILAVKALKYQLNDIYIAIALLVNTFASAIAVIYSINKNNKKRIRKYN